jgi:DNA-binding PucR family transcriptional regulator
MLTKFGSHDARTRRADVDMAASELIVHKNTIRYRLAQAEELIGHPLSERRAHLELALRYLDWSS